MAKKELSAAEFQTMFRARFAPVVDALDRRDCFRAKRFLKMELERYQDPDKALKGAIAYGKRWRVKGDGAWLAFFKEVIPLILPFIIK